MSNRAIWNVRLRHEWLQKEHKGKRIKRRTRLRIGLQDAIERQEPEPGEHELVAVFTGQGPHTRDYRRAASLVFEKGIGPKYIELTISDRVSKQQPEFVVKEWE
jgi:hypothetical protein